MIGRMSGIAATAMVLLALPWTASAEPYLAVESGFRCVQCHVNPTGGGLRTPFGNAWAQTQMSARLLGSADQVQWLGRVAEFLAIGGNLRADGQWTRIPDGDSTSSFELSEARLYLSAEVIPGRLSLYVDERFAPGNATNMEANLRLVSGSGRYYLKAGRMYLPFGWRLEDDNAFVRQLSGINMQTPDEAVEAGLDIGPWSAQVAVSNGAGGGPEIDDGKQITGRVEYVRSKWRVGASALYNDLDSGSRTAGALFAGWKLGPTHWLAEIDYVDDEALGLEGRQLLAGLIETNWRFRKGHNLKLTHEWLDPDTDVDEDERTRSSVAYEWSPIQFLQLRAGFRRYDGPGQIDAQNRSEGFVQLHGYF